MVCRRVSCRSWGCWIGLLLAGVQGGCGDGDGGSSQGGGEGGASTVTSASVTSIASTGPGTTTASAGGAGGVGEGGAAEGGAGATTMGAGGLGGSGGSGAGSTGGEAEMVLDAVNAPTGLDVDDTFVYFGSRGHAPSFDDGYVAKVPKEGGEAIVIAADQTMPLHVREDGDAVIWTVRGTPPAADGAVMAAPKGGGEAWIIADDLLAPGNPVILGELVYFTARDGTVRRARRDGSERGGSTVVATDVVDPRDLAAYEGVLYWAEGGDEVAGVPPQVVRKELPDGEERVLATGITTPSFQLGFSSDSVYLGSFDRSQLVRVPMSGEGPAVVLADQVVGSPHEVVLGHEQETVFFTTGALGRILAVDAQGGPTFPSVVWSGGTFTAYLTSDDDWLYWTDGVLSAEGGAIRRIEK